MCLACVNVCSKVRRPRHKLLFRVGVAGGVGHTWSIMFGLPSCSGFHHVRVSTIVGLCVDRRDRKRQSKMSRESTHRARKSKHASGVPMYMFAVWRRHASVIVRVSVIVQASLVVRMFVIVRASRSGVVRASIIVRAPTSLLFMCRRCVGRMLSLRCHFGSNF